MSVEACLYIASRLTFALAQTFQGTSSPPAIRRSNQFGRGASGHGHAALKAHDGWNAKLKSSRACPCRRRGRRPWPCRSGSGRRRRSRVRSWRRGRAGRRRRRRPRAGRARALPGEPGDREAAKAGHGAATAFDLERGGLHGLDRRLEAELRVVREVRGLATDARRLRVRAVELRPHLAPPPPARLGIVGRAHLRVEPEDPPLPVEQGKLV